MIKYSFYLFFLLGAGQLLAQQSVPAGQNFYDDGSSGIIYNKELSFDFRLITPRSFGFGVNIGELKSYNRTRFFNIEFGDIRHPQEYRQSFDFQFSTSNRVSRAFVYGKQNSAFVLRAGIGEKRYFSEKAKTRGLAVGMSYQIGANLGLLKPYYLELLRSVDPSSGTNRFLFSEERYSEDNANIFLDLNRIVGSSAFSKGLNEIGIMPGLHAKAAAHFDWGAFDELVKAVEAGVMIDVYFKDVPIMVENDNVRNSPIFLNFYLNLQLGKRR
jgi:hypothetical protein